MKKIYVMAMMFICLLIGVLIGYAAKSIAVIAEENNKTDVYQKYPRRTIVVTIEVDQQDLLFEKMQDFADEKGFAIRIAHTTPNEVDYIVEMWREDTKIIALNSFDPGAFRVGFFDTDSAVSSPDWAVDSLVHDFKSYIDEIPNITIAEEKENP